MKKASITEAKNQLSALIAGLKSGSPVLIVDRGRPVARLEPVMGGPDCDPDGRLARLIRDGIVRSTAQRWPGIVEADSSQLGAHDVAELSRQDFPRTGADVLPGGAIRPRPR